jgi:RHS repeat-associated protein
LAADYDEVMSGPTLYMQQRYYEPLAGRFLSVDPVTTDAKTGSNFNRYNYANNNPYRFKDPDGRIAIPLIPLIVEAIAASIASNAGAAAVGIAGGVAIGAVVNQNSAGSAAPAPSTGQQVSSPPPGTQSSSQGCIYCVKGENTSSGRDYVGSTDNMGQRAKDNSDGRNRQGADAVGSYDKGDKQGRRNAEQQAINDRGGVDKLDNKRNEVAPKNWTDQGIKAPEKDK